MLLTLSRYLRVGALLHLMTVAEIALIVTITVQFDLLAWIAEGGSLWKVMALYPLWSMPMWAQLDARSRYQNYLQVKDQMYHFGYRERILRPVLTSRCQRDAAAVAAEELGDGAECRAYFYEAGYRWYHLLPDILFRMPWRLLHPAFLRTTFFAPTYRVRYLPEDRPARPELLALDDGNA